MGWADGHAWAFLRVHRDRPLVAPRTLRRGHVRPGRANRRSSSGKIRWLHGGYRLWRLVHAEPFAYVRDAIAREKQLKGWKRGRKIALIESRNPDWLELGRDANPTTGSWGPSGLRPSG